MRRHTNVLAQQQIQPITPTRGGDSNYSAVGTPLNPRSKIGSALTLPWATAPELFLRIGQVPPAASMQTGVPTAQLSAWSQPAPRPPIPIRARRDNRLLSVQPRKGE